MDLPRPATPARAPQRRSPAGRWPGRSLAVGLVVLAVLTGGLFGLRQRQKGAERRDITPFTTVVREGSLPGIVTASGEVGALEQVNISPKQQGQLLRLFVDEGDTVAAGQPIAEMDPSDTLNRLQELKALYESAQIQRDKSLGEFERRRQLFDQGGLSRDDLLRFQAAYENDERAVMAARQRLAQRQVLQNDLIVRAPFAGRITNRYADPGSFVTPTTAASATAGATSSSIVELSSGLLVKARVPESDIGRIRLGQQARVRVDAYPDDRYPAVVDRISPRAEKTNNVTSVEVRLRLINPALDRLRIGMTADVDFDAGQLPPKPLLPTVAIVTENGKPGVLVPGKDGQPTFREVALGSSSGRDTQVLQGVNAGDRVFLELPPWAKKRRES